MAITTLYPYATDRTDGMIVAVGAVFDDAPVNGSFALFTDRDAAITFTDAMREKHGCAVLDSPSVFGGPGMIQLPNGLFHPASLPKF